MIIERLAGKMSTAGSRAPGKGSVQTKLDPGEISTAMLIRASAEPPTNGKLDKRQWSAAADADWEIDRVWLRHQAEVRWYCSFLGE